MIKIEFICYLDPVSIFVWQQLDPKILNTAIIFICLKKNFCGGKIYVALGDVEPTVYKKLDWKSERSACLCLCLLSVEIKGIHYHF